MSFLTRRATLIVLTVFVSLSLPGAAYAAGASADPHVVQLASRVFVLIALLLAAVTQIVLKRYQDALFASYAR